MNRLIRFFVDNYVLTFSIFGALVLFGVVSALRLGIDLLPEFEIPIVAVVTAFMTMRRGPKRVGILATAGAVAILGLLVGLEVSALWWFGRPLDLVRR